MSRVIKSALLRRARICLLEFLYVQPPAAAASRAHTPNSPPTFSWLIHSYPKEEFVTALYITLHYLGMSTHTLSHLHCPLLKKCNTETTTPAPTHNAPLFAERENILTETLQLSQRKNYLCYDYFGKS